MSIPKVALNSSASKKKQNKKKTIKQRCKT